MTSLRSATATDPGRVRSVNEDRAVAVDGLMAIADGMGGAAGGEVAARLAVESVERTYAGHRSAEDLIAAVKQANADVFRRGASDRSLRGMGTTLTAAALIDSDGVPQVAITNVGDSRAYLFSGGELRRLTEDHTLVEEMVRRGELTEQAAKSHPHRHILTRVIGVESDVDVDAWTIEVGNGDRVLLCSDGLTNECPDDEIAQVLRENEDPEDAVKVLVERALRHGGSDNITVVLADVEGYAGQQIAEPQASPARAPREPRPQRDVPARRPLITPLSVLFVVAFLAILGVLAGVVDWFVKASYFVGLDGSKVAIYEGRPGGFLWFQPTVAKLTSLDESAVYPPSLPFLRSGLLEPSYTAAVHVVNNLSNEKALLGAPRATVTTTSTATKG